MIQLPSHEQMLNSCNHGVIATDRHGMILFINHKAREALKFGKKKLVGKKIIDVLPITGGLMMESIKTGEPQSDHQIIGKRANFIVNVNAIKQGKTVTGAVCDLLIMEEFEAVARKLDYYEFLDRKFKTVFEASSDGLWVCDGQGRVIDVNTATEKLGGIKKIEVIGKKVSDLIKKEGLYNNYVTDEVIRKKHPISQLQTITKTNKVVLCTGIPVLDKEDNVSLVVINERDITQLHAIQEQLEEMRKEKERYKNELTELSMKELETDFFVAENEKMKQIINTSLKFAHMGVSDIMLLGESGTGKGLLAKIIHKNSERRKKPFIQLNCAAIPESLLEAELFGYERGAFTGAKESGKPGLLELADEGTLFLDEIGEMPLTVQAKMLKYLDDHEIMRLGGTKSKKIDCILIAATNQDLENLSKNKKFRLDLFYRLNSLVIKIPPLRERPEDIYELTNTFLVHFNRKYKLKKKINPLTIALMQSYSFAGNVRELRNIIRKSVLMSDTDLIDNIIISSIGKEVIEEWGKHTVENKKITNLVDILSAFEKEIIKSAMKHNKSTRQIAKHLNVSQPTVVRKLKKYGLSVQ